MSIFAPIFLILTLTKFFFIMSYYISFKVISKDSGEVLFERVCTGSSPVPCQQVIESLDYLYSSLPHFVTFSYEKLD